MFHPIVADKYAISLQNINSSSKTCILYYKFCVHLRKLLRSLDWNILGTYVMYCLLILRLSHLATFSHCSVSQCQKKSDISHDFLDCWTGFWVLLPFSQDILMTCEILKIRHLLPALCYRYSWIYSNRVTTKFRVSDTNCTKCQQRYNAIFHFQIHL